MKLLLLFAIALFCLCTSCKKEESDNAMDVNSNELSYIDFKENLKDDMTYDAIVSRFGSPKADIGSGIHIYVYLLNDSTKVLIGYANKIIYARHVDKSKKVLDILIGTYPGLTFTHFKENLKADMTYSEIISKFGEPSRDAGSGIHIFVYTLNDSTEIWIGYVGKIIYARHVNSNRDILDILI